MDITDLTPDLSVAPQIAPGDMAQIAALGFRAVICNRPDEETPGQPPFSAIAAAAEGAGLIIRHQPVISGALCDEDASAFAALLATLPAPVLAYCRSGARCTKLWQLAAQKSTE